jgi:VIT1/CCC1 family predicted Fe2+/Mn2+ transporter
MPQSRRRNALDPIDRLAEVMFGLLMTLGLVGGISVSTAGTWTVRELMIAVIGCNIAWGVVDAFMYLVATLAERGREKELFRAIRDADDGTAVRMTEEMIPLSAGAALRQDELRTLTDWLRARPDDGKAVRLHAGDWWAALTVFLVVLAATFPPTLPFLFLDSVPQAMRLSNLISIILFFLIGLSMDRMMGNIVRLRVIVPVAGIALVGVIILFGG